MNELTFYEKYLDIVQRLEVPKLKENSFAGFQYRSIEDIEEKLKPFLKEHKLGFKFTDRMVDIGTRVYCEATAILFDEKGNKEQATAYAREAEKPKAKTDDAQLTGGVSSYARKYAAQGLFLIDDGKGDPDNQSVPDATAMGLSSLTKAKGKLFSTFTKAGIDDSQEMMRKIEQAIGKNSIDTAFEAEKVIKLLEDEMALKNE